MSLGWGRALQEAGRLHLLKALLGMLVGMQVVARGGSDANKMLSITLSALGSFRKKGSCMAQQDPMRIFQFVPNWLALP